MPSLNQVMTGRGSPSALHMNTILRPSTYSDSKCDHRVILAPCRNTRSLKKARNTTSSLHLPEDAM
ncbi:hypothetical protein E2C01_080061 [Portunus trituberculatus]|uniref:Uncharacterized protein n=1 Tax=Portunus trituberculatus TaxID=210409 RepID=A0A5B7ISE8_PORTR|nr:hypothetical protein [Portunus trituberculatus]